MAGRFLEKDKMQEVYEAGGFTYGRPVIFNGVEGAVVRAGSYCSIAPGVIILLGVDHWPERVSTYPFAGGGECTNKGNVTIGNDVWIGLNACILSGVTINDGAVIGAYSVVVKDVESYSITAGNPAKHIKYRFTPEQIEALLEIKWWNWPPEKIARAVGDADLISDDIDAFIRKHGGTK